MMFVAKPRRKQDAKLKAKPPKFDPTTTGALSPLDGPSNIPLQPSTGQSSIYPQSYTFEHPAYDNLLFRPPPRPLRPSQPASAFSNLAVQPGQLISNIQTQWQGLNAQQAVHGALCDLISSKFDAVITSIDGENFTGNEKELEIRDDLNSGIRGGWGSTSREVSRGANRAISSAVVSTNYFPKANLYANSRLPPNLPQLKL